MRTAPSSAACSRTQSSLTPSMRIHEALAINEPDLDHRRGALLVRRGKGGRRREVGMDEWAWEHLQPWLDVRLAECRAALLGFIGMRGYGFDSGPPHPAVTEGPEPRWPRHPPRSIGSRPRPPCRVDVPPVHVPAMGLGGAPEALLVWVGGWVGAITTAANDDRPDAFLYDLMITAARLAGQQVVDRLLGAERPPDPSRLAVLERATADYEAYRRAGGFVMRFPNPDGTVVEVPFASPPGAGV